MSQEQAERALLRLYEETNTRDELTDDEAEVLLRWGEAQIERLAAANMDDARFDEAFAHLIKLMTRMNRFAARRAEQSPDEQQTALNRIVESASAAGLPITQPPDSVFGAQGASDTLSNLQALIAMLTPEANAAPAEPSPRAIIPAESIQPVPTEKAFHGEEEQPTDLL